MDEFSLLLDSAAALRRYSTVHTAPSDRFSAKRSNAQHSQMQERKTLIWFHGEEIRVYLAFSRATLISMRIERFLRSKTSQFKQ